MPVSAGVIRLFLVLQQQAFSLELSEDIMLSNTHDGTAQHVMARYRPKVYRFQVVLMGHGAPSANIGKEVFVVILL